MILKSWEFWNVDRKRWSLWVKHGSHVIDLVQQKMTPCWTSAIIWRSVKHFMRVKKILCACLPPFFPDTPSYPTTPQPLPKPVHFPMFISQALEFVTHATAAVWYNNYPSVRVVSLLPSLSGILVCRKKPGEKQKHCWEETLLENARTSRGQVGCVPQESVSVKDLPLSLARMKKEGEEETKRKWGGKKKKPPEDFHLDVKARSELLFCFVLWHPVSWFYPDDTKTAFQTSVKSHNRNSIGWDAAAVRAETGKQEKIIRGDLSLTEYAVLFFLMLIQPEPTASSIP